jgi:hypothetical protein
VVALIPQGDLPDLKEMMAFVTNDRNMQVLFQRGVKDAYFPTDNSASQRIVHVVFGNGTLAALGYHLGTVPWIGRSIAKCC